MSTLSNFLSEIIRIFVVSVYLVATTMIFGFIVYLTFEHFGFGNFSHFSILFAFALRFFGKYICEFIAKKKKQIVGLIFAVLQLISPFVLAAITFIGINFFTDFRIGVTTLEIASLFVVPLLVAFVLIIFAPAFEVQEEVS